MVAYSPGKLARPVRLRILAVTCLLIGCLAATVKAAGDETTVGWSPWFQDAPPSDTSELADIWERWLHKAQPVLDDGSAGLQQRRLAGEKAPSGIDAIVVMCDFADSLMYGRHEQVGGDFPDPMQSDFYFAAHDSLFFAHMLQNVTEYFTAVSDGQFTLNYDVCPRTINLPQPMAWYGDHPDEGEQSFLLAAEVVDSLDVDIDFSLYDTVILVHAGAGEETDILNNSPEQIYSTYLSPEDFATAVEDTILPLPYIPTDDFDPGEGVDHVLILPETEFQDPVGSFAGYFGSLGVYCFEVGLRIGMLSLSDFTPAGRPDSQGIGEFGLMGYGLFVGAGFIPPHPCVFNKLLMGWVEPYPAADQEGFTLTPVEQCNDPYAAARIDITGREYWLLAYRLQDPDGNRIFSFSGDLNGNNVPDFYDADSEFDDGSPTGFFNAETDTLEYLTGAEWDFFMSENNAREPGIKGAGSGVYVWHIDEGVIERVFDAESNLFNADPLRKSVDLEEADGIQDLDSRTASAWILGGDDDSFRGEGNTVFDATSDPSTETAGGAWTGFTIDGFNNVVMDSFALDPVDSTLFVAYADTMFFSTFREDATIGEPYLVAEHLFEPGVDLRGSHLVAAKMDPDTCAHQIVVSGRAGELFVLSADLSRVTVPLLDTTGTPWHGCAAVGNLAGDNGLEVVLTRPEGLYAYTHDLHPVRFLDPQRPGLLLPLACGLPPILLPCDGPGATAPTDSVVACVVNERLEGAFLRFIDEHGMDYWPEVALGTLEIPAAPSAHNGVLAVAAIDPVDHVHKLLLMNLTNLDTVPSASIDLAVRPNAFPVTLGSDEEGDFFALVSDTSGSVQAVYFDRLSLAETGSADSWPDSMTPGSRLAPGLSVMLANRFGLATRAGAWHTGWPVQPAAEIYPAAPEVAPAGLRVQLDFRPVFLFASRDGRLFLYDEAAELLPGWPLAGPADIAGTPLLLDLDDDDIADLAAVGTFPRIVGLDDEGTELVTEMQSRLMVWTGLGEYHGATGGWAMWGGSPWRGGGVTVSSTLPEPAGTQLLVDGSHFCYPSPLLAGPLTVRAAVVRDSDARVFVYNLEGQQVALTNGKRVLAGEPFEITVDLDNVVTGLYLCRLVVEDTGNRRDENVVTIAVVR